MFFYYEEVDIIQVRREGQVLKFWGFETNKKERLYIISYDLF